MHIKLSTNSREARKFINTLGNIDCGYGYSYGFGEDEELNKKNSWGVKLFYGFDKLLSQTNALPNEDKEIINYISDTANYLNYTFSQEDPDYIKNMSIVMNVNSKFNTVIQKSLGLIKEFAPSYASKLATGVDQFAGTINPQTKKMIIGSSLFEENDDAHPFVPYLINKLGMEKAVEFVVFHEASHTFEKTNVEKHGIKWDDRISDMVLLAHELEYVSKEDMNTSIGVSLNKLIEDKHLEQFFPLDMKFLNEIKTLQAEIYADAGAVLLVRNSQIENGTYTKEKLTELIDIVIEGRRKEHDQATERLSSAEYVSLFNHFTVLGLQHLKEIIDTIPEASLTQKEIYEYASNASKVGLARTVLTSSLANPKNTDQLSMLFNLEYHAADGFIGLPDKIDDSKTQEGLCKLIDLAGPQWFDGLSNKIEMLKHIDSENKVGSKIFFGNANKIKNIWWAASNKELFNKNIYNYRKLSQKFTNGSETYHDESDKNSSLYIDNPTGEPVIIPTVKPKEEVLGVLNNLRKDSPVISKKNNNKI
jgi:hypothetical protein